ncbi:MAG: AAA family ATPase [Acidobacteriia bacterium]|nr:AAA family ATPase [Terriglobia bacterium]
MSTLKFFAPYRLDPANQCLWRGDSRISMPPKVFDVLRFLVENAGRLVTQQELLEAVWPETFVQPEILRKYILEIRKALGDPPDHPVFIETLPKRGYRFIAPVNNEVAAAEPAVQELPGRFVGRDAPLAELKHRLDAAVGGARQLVFVTGEGGIGKTTLLDAFEHDSAHVAGLRIARGQCVEGFGGKESYYPVLEAFGQWISGPGGDAVVRVLAEHAPTWLVQFPSAIRAEQRASLQQEILGATRERMLREVCQALERLSAAQPVVLILEDLQWVDDSTLDLISAIARRRTPARLMLVGTYRPVDVILSASPLKQMKQDLLVHRLCHEISVEPLTEPQVERYLAAEFPESDLPRSLAATVHRRSEGNPMFMVAIVDEMRQKGLLAEQDGRWVLTVPADRLAPGIPQTLQQLLEIEIERLGPEERGLLGAASVAGQKFSAWAAAAMLERGVAEIEDVSENLAARHAILKRAGTQEQADGSESPQYEFKHALYREVLYAQLPASQRRRLHARLAEAMESLSASAEQALASELALHFEEARSYSRAVRYLILTAANARRRYAHDDSIRLLRHALDLLAHVPAESAHNLRIQILERISDALYAQGEMMQSADVDRAVVEQAAQHGFVVAQVNSLTRLARALAFMDPGRCIAVCDRAAELARTQDDPLLTARAEMLAACWRIITHGWSEQDAAVCAAARATIRRNEEIPAYYEILYAHVECIAGDYEGAYRTARAGIPQSIENDNLVVYFSAHSSLAHALLHLGRLGELLEVLRTALEVAEKNHNLPWIGIFRANLAWVRFHCGDLDGAKSLAQELIREHVDEAGQVRTMATIAMGFAELESGAAAKAVEHFSEAVAQPAPQFFLDWYWRAIGQLGLSRAFLAAGDAVRAAETAEIFFDSADKAADPGSRAFAWEWRARLALQRGHHTEAREYAEKALAAIAPFNIPMVAWRIERTAAECFAASGDQARASEHRALSARYTDRLIQSLPEGDGLRESLGAR